MGLVEFTLIGIALIFSYATIIELLKTIKEIRIAKINADTFKNEKE